MGLPPAESLLSRVFSASASILSAMIIATASERSKIKSARSERTRQRQLSADAWPLRGAESQGRLVTVASAAPPAGSGSASRQG